MSLENALIFIFSIITNHHKSDDKYIWMQVGIDRLYLRAEKIIKY